MYAGEVVERGPVEALFHYPGHPYTQALLRCDPARVEQKSSGAADHPRRRAEFAVAAERLRLHRRCPIAIDRCRLTVPPPIALGPGHAARCIRIRDDLAA